MGICAQCGARMKILKYFVDGNLPDEFADVHICVSVKSSKRDSMDIGGTNWWVRYAKAVQHNTKALTGYTFYGIKYRPTKDGVDVDELIFVQTDKLMKHLFMER